MAFKSLIWILASVIFAGFVTLSAARMAAGALNLNGGWLSLAIPPVLVGLVLWRLASERRK